MKILMVYLLVISFIAYLPGYLSAQEKTLINYFNCEPPPADSAVIFAKGIVSIEKRWEEKICFTPDGKEVFFGRHPNGGKDYFKPSIMYSKFDNNKWSKPDTANFAKNRLIGWPILSLDGTVLYMEEIEGKIVYSKKEDDIWTEPEPIYPDLIVEKGFGLAQITDDSTFYFYDRSTLLAYYSKITNGKYSKPILLSDVINPAVEFYVSPKNEYIIYKPDSWENEFHISFQMGENNWSEPIPFSAYFKKEKGWDNKGGGPSISPDSKYLFFLKRGDIYWVKTDFIEVLSGMSK